MNNEAVYIIITAVLLLLPFYWLMHESKWLSIRLYRPSRLLNMLEDTIRTVIGLTIMPMIDEITGEIVNEGKPDE